MGAPFMGKTRYGSESLSNRLKNTHEAPSNVRCGPPALGFMFPKFLAFRTMTVMTWGWVGPAGWVGWCEGYCSSAL